MQKVQMTVLIISTITSFLGPFLISSINIALPSIEKDLNLDSIELSWIINAFLLTSAILLLPSGTFADQYGQVKGYRIGIIIFTVSSLLCGIALNYYSLIIFRIIQGIGAAMTMATGPSLLVSQFPGHQRGRVLGINVAAVYLGLSLGPFLGGVLTNYWGWRSIFLISAPLGALTMILTLLWLKNEIPENNSKKGFNIHGNLFYALILFLFVYGASELPHTIGWITISGFIFLMPLFFKTQNNSNHPVLPVKLFKSNKLFTYSNLAALINYSGTFATIFYLSLYLQKINEFSPFEAGAILIFQPITQAVLSPLTGYFSDKVEPRFLATSGMLLNALGLFLLAFINSNTPVTLIIIYLIIMGVGFALFSSPNMNTIMGSVERPQLGTASGVSATMRILGQITSMSIATLLFSVVLQKTPIMDAESSLFIHTMKSGMIIMSLLCLSGSYFSYFRGKMRK